MLLRPGEVYKVGPDSYRDKPGWTDKDLDPDIHVYQDRYAFVRFDLATAPVICLRTAVTVRRPMWGLVDYDLES